MTPVKKMKRKASTTGQVVYKKPMLIRQPTLSLANPPSRKGLSIEKKNVDITTGATTSATAGLFSSFLLLNGMAQGATSNDRVGRKINMKSLLIRGHWIPPSTQSDLRFYVVYDKQTNAATPSNATALTESPPDIDSMQNLDGSDRYIVLVDEIIEMAQGASTRKQFKIYRKLNLEVIFNSNTAGTVGDIVSGGVFAAFATSQGSTPVSFKSRIRFTDI